MEDNNNNSDDGVPPPSISPEHELKRETAYPQYLPSTGMGSKMRGEQSGEGVLVDGVERTRENTPMSTPSSVLPGGNSTSNGVNNDAASNGTAPNLAAQSGVGSSTNSDGLDVHPGVSSKSTSTPAHPSYFPPFSSSSSSSPANTSNINGSNGASAAKPTFPNSLANSRDKSSILGHATPPHHGLPSPVQEEREEDVYTPFPAASTQMGNVTSSDSENQAAIADKFDINAFNAIGSDLSNLQLEGLTIVSGDTDADAVAVSPPAVAPVMSVKSPATSTTAKNAPAELLTQHAKQLDVIANGAPSPSSGGGAAANTATSSAPSTAASSVASSPKPDNRSRSSSTSANAHAHAHAHAPTTPSSLSSSTHTSPTKPPASASQNHLQPPPASTTSHPVRPAVEHKKSMFGKLFQSKDKDKDKQQQQQQYRDDSHQSSNATSPSSSHGGDVSARNTSTSRERERGTSSTRGGGSTRERGYSSSGAVSGTESEYQTPPPMVRRPSANAVKDKDSHTSSGGMGSFFGRRSSNKKMPQPDQSLVNMKNNSQQQQQATPSSSSRASPAASSVSIAATGTTSTTESGSTMATASSPSASTVTLGGSQSGKDGNTLALPGAGLQPSSTAASRGSTPDINNVPNARTAAPSPSRQSTMDNTSAGGGRPMIRRPSGSSQQSGLKGNTGITGSGAHTPAGATDEKHQVSQKSLREHLAALGSSASAGMGIGKLGRKASQTSRKSDDGRSEKSGYHPDEHAPPVPAIPGEGSSSAPHIKRTPSVGGASVASSSLQKKYGYCEKVAIGKGATAVVKLAHKWDRSTEKLYAVKEFRKRRKNESEKEYVKKLTSEFCISSTLHHINIVETVDLVQNEEKHWCEVMEYCPGGDLYAAIKKGNMTAEDSNLYFKQIVTGVAYLHSMGVAHRDIKPENLLLDALGHIKITDFGVSDVFRMCWEKQTHLSKGLCGSEPYIAPEQFDHKEYDARLVDVWATAVVFYCMQAQELPWRVAKQSDPSFQSYLQYYPASSTPPPLGNLHPKECRAIVKKMLDPNPKTRIHMDAVLADPWVKAIAYDVPPEAPSTTLRIP